MAESLNIYHQVGSGFACRSYLPAVIRKNFGGFCVHSTESEFWELLLGLVQRGRAKARAWCVKDAIIILTYLINSSAKDRFFFFFFAFWVFLRRRRCRRISLIQEGSGTKGSPWSLFSACSPILALFSGPLLCPHGSLERESRSGEVLKTLCGHVEEVGWRSLAAPLR